VLLVFAGLLTHPPIAGAQPQPQLAISAAPYYEGVPITIQITADGFEEEPQPEIRALGPVADKLRYAGVSPNVSRSVRIVNGQISQSTLVRFIYSYELVPPRVGAYQIGPFEISQSGVTKRSGATTVQLQDVPISREQQIRVLIPEGNLYVGQRFPIQIEWLIDPEMRGSLFNQRITIPVLELERAFSIVDVVEIDAAGDKLNSSLMIATATGANEYPAAEGLMTVDGVEYVVRRTVITLLALAAGTYELDPATVVVDQATAWRRDLFGSRDA
jgi:hypothetical protein